MKMLLNKNAHLCNQDKMVMMLANTSTFGAKMEDALDTFELMEAVLNYLACTYMICSSGRITTLNKECLDQSIFSPRVSVIVVRKVWKPPSISVYFYMDKS